MTISILLVQNFQLMEYLEYASYGWCLISAVILMFQRDRNEKQSEKLRNEITHLRGGVTIKKRKERVKFQTEQEAHIEQLKRSLESAFEEVRTLKSDLEEKTKKVKDLNGWIETMKPGYRSNKEELHKEERRRRELQKRCEDQKEEIAFLKRVNADLGEQMKRLQEDSKKLAGITKEEHSQQLATLNETIKNTGLHAQEVERQGRVEVEGLKEQMETLAKLYEQTSSELKERNTELEVVNGQSFQLSKQLTALEESKQRDINGRLLQMVHKTALAQRYINEMYRRGEIALEVRESAIYKTEILQEIENKIIDEKNAQILTREGQLQLSTNTSLFEITRSQYDVAVQIDSFRMEKREYTLSIKLDEERWEIKRQLDTFDISKQRHALEVLADRTTDERRKAELLNIADTLDLERTRQGLQVFSDSLDSQREKMELQKLLNEFDSTKELHKLKVFSDSLTDRERKAQLDVLLNKLDNDKTKLSLERLQAKLESEKDRHDVQVMIDAFDLEKGKTALIQAKERFIIRVEREVNELQAKIDRFTNEQARHELQKKLDVFNLEVREKKRELEDLKHDLRHDIKSHQLQVRLDDFNAEMKEQTHGLKVLHDELNLKDQRFDIKVQRENLDRFNHEIEAKQKAVETYFKQQQEILELRVERGDLQARTQLVEIRERNAQVQEKLTDLKFSKREIKTYANEREQSNLSKELKYKQDILFSIYDQLEVDHPKVIDKKFSRMGYAVESPYKKALNMCEHEKNQLKNELEKLKR